MESNIPINISSFGSIAIACGQAHTVALDSTGNVHTWGYNNYGNLGNNNNPNNSIIPINISSFGAIAGKFIAYIACADYNTYCIDIYGIGYGCGNNSNYQVGNNSIRLKQILW